jgi:hypothetical protein
MEGLENHANDQGRQHAFLKFGRLHVIHQTACQALDEHIFDDLHNKIMVHFCKCHSLLGEKLLKLTKCLECAKVAL